MALTPTALEDAPAAIAFIASAFDCLNSSVNRAMILGRFVAASGSWEQRVKEDRLVRFNVDEELHVIQNQIL